MNTRKTDLDSHAALRGGEVIVLEFSVTLDDGTPVDSNVGQMPLIFRIGEDQLLPRLEQQMLGMVEGQHKRVRITPDYAYGQIDSTAYREVELDAIPEDAREVGKMVLSQDPHGARRQARVHALYDDKIILDFNHPLAGKALVFDVRILERG